jgi:hypothetical protein
MHNEEFGWINREKLDALVLEILDRKDKISEIFEKINSCMSEDRLGTCYKGASRNELIVYYNSLKTSFTRTKENIKTYADDLINLSYKFKQGDRILSGTVQDMTTEVKRKTNEDSFKL